jgi:hypothetical protein
VLINHAVAIIAWYFAHRDAYDRAGASLWREFAIPDLDLIKQAKQAALRQVSWVAGEGVGKVAGCHHIHRSCGRGVRSPEEAAPQE